MVNGGASASSTIDPSRLDGFGFGPVTVPPHLFLLGDERDSAIDLGISAPSPPYVRGFVEGRLWPSPGPLRVDRRTQPGSVA